METFAAKSGNRFVCKYIVKMIETIRAFTGKS